MIASLADASVCWNGARVAQQGWAALWAALRADMPRIASRAGAWQAQMLDNGDLAGNLLSFARLPR